jgi:hypothetical protein
MIEVTPPEPTQTTAVPLELRTTRGKLAPPEEIPRLLEERIVLGTPDPVRLSADTVAADDELRAFMTSENARVAYWLVAFTCTFDHDDELPFTTTWIELKLSPEGNAVARSLEPMVLSDEAPPLSWTAKIAFPCVLQPEVDLGGQITREKLFCEASYEGTAKPSWRYYATHRKPIRGQQRMRLIVRMPRSAEASCTVRAGATAKHKRLVGSDLSYTTPVAEPKPWFTLGAVNDQQEG